MKKASVKIGNLKIEINGKGHIDVSKLSEDKNCMTNGSKEPATVNEWKVYSRLGKQGLIDKEGKTVLPCKYNEVLWWSENGYIAVKNNNLTGIVDTGNNIIIPFEYSTLYLCNKYCFKDKNVLIAKKSDEHENPKWGVIDMNNTILIPFTFSNIGYIAEPGSFMVKNNGKYGIANIDSGIIIPAEYGCIEYSNILKCYILSQNSKNGIADIEGKTILPVDFDRYYIGEHRAIFYNEHVIVLIDDNGMTQILPYDRICQMGYNYFVRKNGLWGMIDRDFHETVPCKCNATFIRIPFESTYVYTISEKTPIGDLKETFEDELKQMNFQTCNISCLVTMKNFLTKSCNSMKKNF